MAIQTNPLIEYFEKNQGRLIHKWMHYFEIYHRHFQGFRERAPTVVEVGVFQGGSLQMWRDYFGPKARIIGIDIHPEVKAFAEPATADNAGIEIYIGDQANRGCWRDLLPKIGPIDIFIDDGGHQMGQQIITFEEVFNHIQTDGVYLCEDLHTSHWREYGGGFRSPYSFIEFSKQLIDHLNAWHSRDPHSFVVSPITKAAHSLHFYDSVLVLEKRAMQQPIDRETGVIALPNISEVGK